MVGEADERVERAEGLREMERGVVEGTAVETAASKRATAVGPPRRLTRERIKAWSCST
jgi:hypothetical protein